MTRPRPASRLVLVGVILCAMLGLGAPVSDAAPEGTLTIAMHFSPVTRWLDPAEGESTITWAMARDMLSAEFVLRPAKFHNGDPVTAEDVKFSFERYRGGAATRASTFPLRGSSSGRADVAPAAWGIMSGSA